MRTLAVAWKEILQIRRDPATLLLVVLLPALMLLLFGAALSLNIENVPLAVVDEDRGAAARDLAADFAETDAFDLVSHPADRREASELLDRGTCRAVLVIPAGFSRRLLDGRRASVELLLDGADSNSARVAMGYARVIARRRATEVLMASLPGGAAGGALAPRIETRSRVFYNPTLESAHFIVPGLLGILVLVVAVLMTAMSIARERELGTLETLVASPLGRLELIVGKTLPFIIIAFLDIVIALPVARAAFGVPLRGSMIDLGIVTFIFVTGCLGYGLLVSTVAGTQQAAFQMGLITTLLPAFLLSGFIFPVENMIEPVQAIAAVIPTRYYIAALRAIILKGAPLGAIAPEIGALTAFAVVFPALAALRFQKRVG